MKYSRKNAYRRLKKYIPIPKKLMLLCGILPLAISGVSMISPYLYGRLVDDVMTGGNISLLKILIPAMILVYIVKVILTAFSTYAGKKFAYQTNLETKKRVMEKFLYRDISKVLDNDVGRQNSNLEGDSGAVYTFLSGHVIGFFKSFVVLAIYTTLMLLISPKLCLVSVVLVPLSIYFARKIGNKFNAVNGESYEVKSKTDTHLFDTVQKWREIKSNTLEDQFADEYDRRLEPERRLNSKWMLYFSLQKFFYEMKNSFVMKVLIYFAGGLLIIAKEISIGELLMFMSYMEGMSASLDAVLQSGSDFLGQRASFDRLFGILDEPLPEQGGRFPEEPTVSLENVDFSYSTPENNVLADVSCEFRYGEKYLIVGKSGEGKSTLIKLLLGLHSPQKGRLMLGDMEIGGVDHRSLLQNIGAVMQENMFFNLSIRDNLMLVAPDASEEDLICALRSACLADFVDSLPQKLDTVIGERGVKLSGGQKQRLAIARLILHDPKIVVMDEATSALDSIVEREILNNLNTLFREGTMLVISHKPLASYRYDHICAVENKKVTLTT